MSAGQKATHLEYAATAQTAGMPGADEWSSDGEAASLFGASAQDDVRINHAGKCMALAGRANCDSGRANDSGTAFLRTDRAAGGRGGRESATFKMPAVGGGASDAVPGTPQGRARPPAALDPDMVERIERVISANHPYDSKDRLLRVLPSRVSAADLDRVLGYLERSGKITMRRGVIRWASKPPRSGYAASGKDGEASNNSILAGTRFETIGEGKNPTETIGEYIVRLVNADEPGTYTAEDAKEIDEDMRSLAKGEYYTHEEVLKELGL